MLLSKAFPLLSMIAKSKLPFHLGHRSCCPLLGSSSIALLFGKGDGHNQFNCGATKPAKRITTLAIVESPSSSQKSYGENMSRRAKKKAHRELPESLLKHKLDNCSKEGKLVEALQLYDEARKNAVQLGQHHYNVLLYLCSSAANGSIKSDDKDSDVDFRTLGMRRGFEIYQQMIIDKVSPNEATFTNTARLAAAAEDAEMAFDLIKQMKMSGIPPKLRSYGPALFGFCNNGNAIKAYEVDAHMIDCGVVAEEPELSSLLKVSIGVKKADKVYEMLHRLRASVRQVSESSAEVIEDWFKSEGAANIGEENWDVGKVKEGVIKGGGGWHGRGWLGRGRWSVVKTQMDMKGVCQSCGEKLVSIDINLEETKHFASSLSKLACERERRAGFTHFQEWLQKNGPFDAVVDGANVGLINQHHFSFFQLNSIVNHLRQLSPSKRMPLVVLHQSRVKDGPAKDPRHAKLLERWKKSGALYATPVGSNDDWYWLYAAVSCNCLLVTNDEMRDHLFQLLGTSFFPRWKEKHQVRLSVSREGPTFHMPPPYSIVIQESENGNWHLPTTGGDDIETPRQWLCVTRGGKVSAMPLRNLF